MTKKTIFKTNSFQRNTQNEATLHSYTRVQGKNNALIFLKEESVEFLIILFSMHMHIV